jgi:uncharacterized membrane protein
LGGEEGLIDDQVKAVLLMVIVLTGLLSVGQYWWERRNVEPFSELATLGPDQKIGDYPQTVAVNQSFTLYLYVGDHEGRATFYDIRVKLGNSTSIVNDSQPLNAPVVKDYKVIMTDNQTWLQPLTLSVATPTTNLRLVVEMWIYNSTIGGFSYYDRFNQLFLNVTRG